MKLKNCAVGLLLLLSSFPLLGANRVDLIGQASWIDVSAETSLRAADGGDLEFENTIGYGAGINVFWFDRISTEFMVSVFDAEAAFREGKPPTIQDGLTPDVDFPGGGLPLGGLELIPITGILQFHFAPNAKFDPYIGAGVGYVLIGDLQNKSVGQTGINDVDFEDEIGYLANVGVNVALGERFGLILDIKYMPLETAANLPQETLANIKLDPLTLSAGLAFRF